MREFSGGGSGGGGGGGATEELPAAAASPRLLVVGALLTHGAKVDSRDRYGGTALLAGCRRGWPGCVRALLHFGADPLIADELGVGPASLCRQLLAAAEAGVPRAGSAMAGGR